MTRTHTIRLLSLVAITMVIGGCLTQPEPVSAVAPDGTVSNQQNSAPSIWGSPNIAVLTGGTYSFTPSASDPNGDPVTFSIQNLPRWASFRTSDGFLTGQPLLGDEGLYERISISATDGTMSTALPNFSIEVTQTATGTMTLDWTAPTENADGTTLTDLAGYNIYYGESRGNYPNQIRIDNPSISTYLVENLLPDTYYVVATSFNRNGIESQHSNVAIKTVRSQ